MNALPIAFAGETLTLLPSGALLWANVDLLAVSDLHLGKSERIARRSGSLLPPYEITETLTRLAKDIQHCKPRTILCLGDSFDDTHSATALSDSHRDTLNILQAGRNWLWVEGNHDPGPLDIGGTYLAEHKQGPLTFRHMAKTPSDHGEISGHYHPKARVKGTSRPCFLVDQTRLMMPAYGCYTGGLNWTTPDLRQLFASKATAYLTGRKVLPVPVPTAA
ncbi:MAG: ligase-associated DNA damage response endonuclease PdeM [Boseongicola sp.]|nr:MAG: ligase-associated DNA damage response endonuclease PdeM [Boseongicola sp.]